MRKPRFELNQLVNFVGGSGIIRSLQAQSGTWSYLIEMEVGPNPEMSRVGDETKILLLEPDINF